MLLLVALCTVGCILCAEGLGAVVACTAELSGIDVSHRHRIAALLHLEEAGLMAVCALQTLVRVNLAVEYHLAGAATRELDRLTGRNREGGNGQHEGHNNYDCYDEKLFHS